VHARRDEQLRAGLAAGLDNILQMLSAGVESADNPDLKVPPREAATTMLALGAGLGLLRSIDPSIPVNGLIDTLRLITGQPI
jgi:hypothetical protein